MVSPLREHAKGVGIALALIIIGIVLIALGFYLNQYGAQGKIVSQTVSPLQPLPAASFNYVYTEYGPLCNLTIPPPPEPLSLCSIGVLFNYTGVGHAQVTVPMWVTLQPPSIAQRTLIYNFTVVFKLTNVNGYKADYEWVFPASVGEYVFYAPNGAYVKADIAVGTSTLYVFIPAAQASIYIQGIGGFPLSFAATTLECNDESAFAAQAPQFVTNYIPMPSGNATSVPCTAIITVPVFPGHEQVYRIPLTLAEGANNIVIELPVSGIYVPGLGYLGTLPMWLIAIGVFLVILGIVIILIEYHHFRRIQLYKAYGIPPY